MCSKLLMVCASSLQRRICFVTFELLFRALLRENVRTDRYSRFFKNEPATIFFFSFTQNTMSMFNFADKSVNDWIYIRVDRKSIREELPQTYAIISAIQFGIYGRSLIIYYANENEFYVLNTLFKKSYYLIFLCWYQIAVARSFYKKFL